MLGLASESPGCLTTCMCRQSVRVLLLDDDDRVLLVRFHDDDRSWWCTPGGGIEGDETDEEAARREMREEVGLDELALGPWIWRRHHAGTFRGQSFDQSERIYLARVRSFTPRPQSRGQVEHEAGDIRWWTLEELDATSEDLTPRDLPRRVRSLLEDGPPSSPVAVGL
jgi:8-oxo-dGTP pyrophosphatase MutT (NUDIX family)